MESDSTLAADQDYGLAIHAEPIEDFDCYSGAYAYNDMGYLSMGSGETSLSWTNNNIDLVGDFGPIGRSIAIWANSDDTDAGFIACGTIYATPPASLINDEAYFFDEVADDDSTQDGEAVLVFEVSEDAEDGETFEINIQEVDEADIADAYYIDSSDTIIIEFEVEITTEDIYYYMFAITMIVVAAVLSQFAIVGSFTLI
jgi:hypothetical protein